jgi:hypothetical protein
MGATVKRSSSVAIAGSYSRAGGVILPARQRQTVTLALIDFFGPIPILACFPGAHPTLPRGTWQ